MGVRVAVVGIWGVTLEVRIIIALNVVVLGRAHAGPILPHLSPAGAGVVLHPPLLLRPARSGAADHHPPQLPGLNSASAAGPVALPLLPPHCLPL